MDSKTINRLKLGVFILLIVGCFYLYQNYSEQLTPSGIRTFVEGYGIWAPVVYGILYLVLTILAFPATVTSVLAGTIFGPVVGSTIVIVSATIAAGIAFYISRYLGKAATEYLEQSMIKNLMSKINKYIEKNGLKAFFILRCLALPYIPFSYAAGLVRKAKFRDFILGTFLTNMIFSPFYVYFGDRIMGGPQALILPAILLILVIAVPILLRKWYDRR